MGQPLLHTNSARLADGGARRQDVLALLLELAHHEEDLGACSWPLPRSAFFELVDINACGILLRKHVEINSKPPLWW